MTDQPPRLSAAPPAALRAGLADRYRIERELGEGGMATVYLAHDLKHDRKVALKVLKPELAAVLGAERFVVEIKTTAALQHPHILPLFDSGILPDDRTGDPTGRPWYTMPFIEGETLRSKLDRETQLGIDEAVKLTMAVADALDYAHRHGVIHRDIKPENILLHDGRPMVADFGIALALSAAAGGRMTETGLSLGTPHYMSPEQATAEKELSARSDIYSLGSVLYEMLTGNPPHVGASAQQIIMKIVTEEAAPVTKLRKSVPPNVAAAVARSLEKLPADRFQSARAFAEALGDPHYAAPGSTQARHAPAHPLAGLPRGWFLGLGALNAILLAAALYGWLRPTPVRGTSRQRVVLWRHAFGSFLSPGVERHATQAAIAPDGSSIVFSDSSDRGMQLMRKLRHEGEPTPMAGTEGAVSPFFSPDGAWVGYITVDGKLRKVPAAGGGSITLAENPDAVYNAAAWLDDGTLIYVADRLFVRSIPEDGGAGSLVMADSSSQDRRTIPTIAPLPGSRGFLFTSCPGNCAIESAVYVFDFAADSARLLVPNAVGSWYVPTGHLLYTDRGGGLYAVGFDPGRLAVTTGPVPIIEEVVPTSVAVSASGSLLYSIAAGGGAKSQLMWVARDGRAEPLDSTWQGDFEYPALSPDGKSLAVSVREGATQLWIWRSDSTRQKLTQEGSVNWRPSWTPDGRSVAYLSNVRGGKGQDDFDAYLTRVDGSTRPELLLRHSFGLWEAEFSRNGEWLVVRSDEAGNDATIRARRLQGDTALIGLVVDKFTTTQVALSPDGRWLAYVSNASGQREIYVAPFPAMGATRLVSRDGGTEPRWAHSGRELFYKSGNRLMAIPVLPGPTFTTGAPRALFTVAEYRGARNRQQYDVAPDDRRFVMIKQSSGDTRAEAVYVENWFAELKARMTVKR